VLCLQLCAQRFPNLYRIAHFGWSARAVDILAAIVTSIVTVIAVSSSGHIEVTMVPMTVSLTNADTNTANPDFNVFRDDHRFVADGERAGKCRHC
jgi:hypothetical protein